LIEREPRRRRGSKREVDVSEMSESELVALLWRRSWAWLAGQRRAPDPVEEALPEVAEAPALEAEAPAKRKRAPKRDAAPDGAAAFRRAAWAWLKRGAEAEAPAKRKRAPRREALPEGVAALRRAAWVWLKRGAEVEAPAKRKRAPKREPVPEGVTALRRAAWAWLKRGVVAELPAKRGVVAEVPAKRKRAPKREPVPEGVTALRRAAWRWLKRARPVAEVVATPAPTPVAVAPPAPVAVVEPPPKRKRALKKEASVPEGVVELRRKAWAWFAPRATGEAAAGSHSPLRVVSTTATASTGNVVLTHLKGVLEALVFASEHPLPAKELARLAKTDLKIARMLLGELMEEYHGRGFRLDEVAGGYLFRTSPLFAPFVREQVAKKPVRMSRAQIETLAIVAYRQPITRPEVDEVRGVDSGAVMKSLLERELVRIIGKKDEPGRPMLYGTTGAFLEFFGLKALGDLPTLREFTELTDESKRTYERELGEDAPEPGAPGEGLMGGEGEMRRGTVDLGGKPEPVDVAALERDADEIAAEARGEVAAEAGEGEKGEEGGKETGDQDVAEETGDQDVAKETGDQDVAEETGDKDVAEETGDQDVAEETGDQDVAEETGDQASEQEGGEGEDEEEDEDDDEDDDDDDDEDEDDDDDDEDEDDDDEA
jgi:segregation and condensation protein B